MIDEQIYRRFNHTVAACFVVYFLFPREIFGIERSIFIILFWLLVVTIEILRFQTPLRQNLEEIRENGGHTKLKLTSQLHDSKGKIR